LKTPRKRTNSALSLTPNSVERQNKQTRIVMLTFKTVSLHFVMFGPFPFLGRIVHIPTKEFGKLHFTWCIACVRLILTWSYETERKDTSGQADSNTTTDDNNSVNVLLGASNCKRLGKVVGLVGHL
jgi:hypothetical protein